MSSKSGLCLMCGHYAPEEDWIGGEGEPYTYHRLCAERALLDVRNELLECSVRFEEQYTIDDTKRELDWLVSRLNEVP